MPARDQVTGGLSVRGRIAERLSRAQDRGERLAAQLANLEKARERIEERIRRLRTALDVLNRLDEPEEESDDAAKAEEEKSDE